MSTSSRQRLYIRSLLHECDLPTITIETKHAPVLKAAGLQAIGGEKLDDWLRALTKAQGGDLVRALQKFKAKRTR